jgi:uncharacterized membrane protein YraQ (UPF0718 family)/copper chaperone CopZ
MMEFLSLVFSASWSMLVEMSPYLLLGFVVAGLLSVAISPRWVERHLGDRGFSQVFKASLFGVPLPLCSCGVIPVGASLRQHGAGKGATTAFLLSTPQTGVDSIAVSYALLGPFLAVVRPVAALLTGFFGGGLVSALDRNGADDCDDRPVKTQASTDCSSGSNGCEPDDSAERKTLVDGLHYGLVILPRDIGRALIVGVLLSGLIAALVEPKALEAYLGGGLLPMLAAMAVGVPLYVCATASTPIALSLIHAGLSPGAALVFLITGPATNAATLTTLWRILGRRSVVIFLMTVAIGALTTGLAVDAMVESEIVVPNALVPAVAAFADGHQHHAEESDLGGWIGRVSAVVMLLLLVNALWPKPQPMDRREVDMDARSGDRVIELSVAGMRCNGCVESVTRALSECEGVENAEVDLAKGRAVVRGADCDLEVLLSAVQALGFESEAIVAG